MPVNADTPGPLEGLALLTLAAATELPKPEAPVVGRFTQAFFRAMRSGRPIELEPGPVEQTPRMEGGTKG